MICAFGLLLPGGAGRCIVVVTAFVIVVVVAVVVVVVVVVVVDTAGSKNPFRYSRLPLPRRLQPYNSTILLSPPSAVAGSACCLCC